jgi:hypothetical protein
MMTCSIDPRSAFNRLAEQNTANAKERVIMRFTLKMAAAVIACAAGFSSTANGQSGLVRLAVPFNFHACDQTFAAGTYEFRTDAAARRVLIISTEGLGACYAPVKVEYARQHREWSRVFFHVYGTAHYLTRVQNAGASAGVELFPSPAEKEMAKGTAAVEVAVRAAYVR